MKLLIKIVLGIPDRPKKLTMRSGVKKYAALKITNILV
jgi:hypothetical protein